MDSYPDHALSGRIKQWLLRTTAEQSTNGALKDAVALSTAVGGVRKENQDRIVAFDVRRGGDPLLVGVILADGVGGGEAGDAAASEAVATVIDVLSSFVPFEDISLEAAANTALMRANQRVHEEFNGNGACTLSGVVFGDDYQPVVLHVGDSRVSLLDRHELVALTIDDNLIGHLNIEKADVRFVQPHFRQLIRYIGMEPSMFASSVKRVPRALSPAILVLTSDGVHGTLEQHMLGVVDSHASLNQIASRLVTAADWFGSRDNASAAVVNMNVILDSLKRPIFKRPNSMVLIELWDPFSQLQILQPAVEVSMNRYESPMLGFVEDVDADISKPRSRAKKRKTTTAKKLPKAKFK